MMTVEVLFAAIDKTHSLAVHKAHRITMQTWKNGQALIMLYDAAGNNVESVFYRRYARITRKSDGTTGGFLSPIGTGTIGGSGATYKA